MMRSYSNCILIVVSAGVRLPSLLLALVLLVQPNLSFGWPEYGGMPVPLRGDTSCVWGTQDCDACVFNVEANFDAISNNNGAHTGHTVLSLEARDDADNDWSFPG